MLYYAFSVLLVPMQRDLGWSRSVLVGGFTVAVVISGLLAPTVGRRLDHGSPRLVMGAGSVGGALLVVGWARADTVVTYYAAWVGIGVAMALVLYEPAFTVIAKRYAPHHHRALTTVTLVAGTASVIFQPLTSALTNTHGWRDTLIILAALLGAVTVPLHLRVLPRRDGNRPAGARPGPTGRRLRGDDADARFWILTAAFTSAAVTSFGTSVLLVAYLVDHGWTLTTASMAGGTLGIMQLPGRLLLKPIRARLGPATLSLMLAAPGLGVLLLLLSGGNLLVWPAVAVLGMSQGLNTLLRITLLVDLYGPDRIGALSGRSATPTVLARALSPLGAASLVTATGGYAAPFLVLAAVAGAAAFLGGRDL